MNAEVIHSAATAVLESRQRETEVLTEAQRFVSSVEAQASSMVHEARSQAANVVASTQAQAAGAVASYLKFKQLSWLPNRKLVLRSPC